MTVAVGCCVACRKVLAEDKPGGGLREAAHVKVLVQERGRSSWKQLCLIKREDGLQTMSPSCVDRLRRAGKQIIRHQYVGVEIEPSQKTETEPGHKPEPAVKKSKPRRRRTARRIYDPIRPLVQ